MKVPQLLLSASDPARFYLTLTNIAFSNEIRVCNWPLTALLYPRDTFLCNHNTLFSCIQFPLLDVRRESFPHFSKQSYYASHRRIFAYRLPCHCRRDGARHGSHSCSTIQFTEGTVGPIANRHSSTFSVLQAPSNYRQRSRRIYGPAQRCSGHRPGIWVSSETFYLFSRS